jgi:hypothetical protein
MSGLACRVRPMESTETTFPSWDELQAARAADPEHGERVPGSPAAQQDDGVPDRFPVADQGPELEEQENGQIALAVEGRWPGLSNEVAGRRPTSSTLAITGGKVEVGGQYQPGDRVTFVVTVVVDHVSLKDEKDPKTQQVVGRARNHKGYIAGIQEQA